DDRVAVVERTYFRSNLEANGAVVSNCADKLQFHAVRLKLDRDGRYRTRCSTLDYGIREQTASQEVRRLPAQSHKVGFCQDLQNVLRLKRLDRCPQIDVGTEDKNVKQVGQAEVGRRSVAVRYTLACDCSKLLRADRSDRICRTRAEQV